MNELEVGQHYRALAFPYHDFFILAVDGKYAWCKEVPEEKILTKYITLHYNFFSEHCRLIKPKKTMYMVLYRVKQRRNFQSVSLRIQGFQTEFARKLFMNNMNNTLMPDEKSMPDKEFLKTWEEEIELPS